MSQLIPWISLRLFQSVPDLILNNRKLANFAFSIFGTLNKGIVFYV